MNKVLFWTYLANAVLLISHEIDSAYWHEWNLFKLPGEITGFLIMHFPLLSFVLFGLMLVYEQSLWGYICSMVLGAGGLFAFFVHTYVINKGRPEFRTPISLFILISILVVSLLQIGISVCLLILRSATDSVVVNFGVHLSYEKIGARRKAVKTMKHFFILLLLALATSMLICRRAAGQAPFVIDAQKDPFYATLVTAAEGRLHISHQDFVALSGPMPNGDADLSANVWTAWDEQYFYLYAEVKDDRVQVVSNVRPWNDCIELKFDPDPTTRSYTGIANVRLSALDTVNADREEGVDNLYTERGCLPPEASSPTNFARRLTSDGYVLELRLKWEWIQCEDKRVQVAVGNVFGFAINVHDIDVDYVKKFGVMERDGTIQWSVGMADEVWLTPQLLGTAEFLPDHKIRFTRRNHIDTTAQPAKTYLSLSKLTRRPSQYYGIENWKYHAGDNARWSQFSFDDRDWKVIYPRMTRQQKFDTSWTGIGWFRSHLVIDSSLWGKPLACRLSHAGAAEIYLNDSLLYAFGKVGTTPAEVEEYLEQEPRIVVFDARPEHVLAIRYANFSPEKMYRFQENAGFTFHLWGEPDDIISGHIEKARDATSYQMVFAGMPLVIGLLHLFLFIFFPKEKENLYFSFFTFTWAAVLFFDIQIVFLTTIDAILTSVMIFVLAIAPAIVFGLLTVYESFLGRIPKHAFMFVLVGLVFVILEFIYPTDPRLMYPMYVFIGLAALETFRVILAAGGERRRERWITAIGFGVFMVSIVYQILVEAVRLPMFMDFPLIYAGILVLCICVSLDFSLNAARTGKKLEQQLAQVKDLSAKALEQERHAKEEEVVRRMLEADNARKTKELEDARQVQLSMLPKEIPQLPHVQIAVKMETATEVGGDYYDFHTSDDGTLTIALGDATGHGTKAGTMVSIAKGLFHEFAEISDFRTVFERFTKAIKFMNLGQLYMGLILVRLKDHTLSASSAGMPPILIYRSATRSVEKVVMKGMPLGSFSDFPYQTRETSLGPGDTVLMMSDGYIEMFNSEDETLDEERAVEVFREVAQYPADRIIARLTEVGKQWANGRPQADDVTFVVLKSR